MFFKPYNCPELTTLLGELRSYHEAFIAVGSNRLSSSDSPVNAIANKILQLESDGRKMNCFKESEKFFVSSEHRFGAKKTKNSSEPL